MRAKAALVLALALAAGPLHAAEKSPVVEFLAPRPKAAIHASKVILIGRYLPGSEKAAMLLNTKPISNLEPRGSGFTAVLENAAPGPNMVQASIGTAIVGSLGFRLGTPVEGTAAYSYHQPVLDGECDSCHAGWKAPARSAVNARTCLSCHEGWKNAFPHGPVAAGECVFCHDPHGSTFPALARAGTDVLCVKCHSQSSSKAHLASSKNKDCISCHDPHGGKNKFILKK